MPESQLQVKLGEKIKELGPKGQGSEKFTQSLLGAVREQHAKAIERVEEVMKEESERQIKRVEEEYNRKLLHMNKILKMAHIPPPTFNDSDFKKMEKKESKPANHQPVHPNVPSSSPTISELKKQIQSLQRLLQSQNHQLCARCGWGWKLFQNSDVHQSIDKKYSLQ